MAVVGRQGDRREALDACSDDTSSSTSRLGYES